MAFLDEVKSSVQAAIEPDKQMYATDHAGANLRENWQDVVNEAKDTYAASKRTAKEVVYILRDKSQQLNEGICESVSSHPWKTIAFSVFAGWFIGKFARFNFNEDRNN